jgi:hypothetical protein
VSSGDSWVLESRSVVYEVDSGACVRLRVKFTQGKVAGQCGICSPKLALSLCSDSY